MPRNARRQPARRERGTGTIAVDRNGYRAKITLPVDGEQKTLRKRCATYEEAEAWLDEQIRLARGGRALPEARREAYTVRSWCRTWLSDKWDSLSPATREDYDSVLGEWVYRRLGDVPLVNLDGSDIRSWLRWLAETPSSRLRRDEHGRAYYPVLSPQRRRYAYRVLHQALQAAVNQRIIQHNPMAGISAPSIPTTAPRERAIPDTALQRILAVVNQHGCNHADGHCALRWHLGLMGMRQGEVLALAYESVHLDVDEPYLMVEFHLTRERWKHGCEEMESGFSCGLPQQRCPFAWGGGLKRLPGTKAGSDVTRALALTPRLVALFREHMAADGRSEGLVFQTRVGTPVNPRADEQRWRDLCTAAGLTQHFRLHDLRHTSATLLLSQGVDVGLVSILLGHSSTQVTRGYLHPSARHTTSAMSSLSGALEALEGVGN